MDHMRNNFRAGHVAGPARDQSLVGLAFDVLAGGDLIDRGLHDCKAVVAWVRDDRKVFFGTSEVSHHCGFQLFSVRTAIGLTCQRLQAVQQNVAGHLACVRNGIRLVARVALFGNREGAVRISHCGGRHQGKGKSRST